MGGCSLWRGASLSFWPRLSAGCGPGVLWLRDHVSPILDRVPASCCPSAQTPAWACLPRHMLLVPFCFIWSSCTDPLPARDCTTAGFFFSGPSVCSLTSPALRACKTSLVELPQPLDTQIQAYGLLLKPAFHRVYGFQENSLIQKTQCKKGLWGHEN